MGKSCVDCIGDECKTCQTSAVCKDLQRQILEIDLEARFLKSELGLLRGTKSLRARLWELNGPYVPAAAFELSERVASSRLVEINHRRQRLLKQLCETCPDCDMCAT